MPDEQNYIAFISYRHKPLDSKTAVAIQKRIENYRVPKDLREQAGGVKLGHVFRDEDELPISSSLSDSITTALDRSKFLIVICTPDLPQSKWCEQEIRYFLQTHDRDHILAVLADGTPEESFSPYMLHEYDADGNITADLEPLAANVAGPDHTLSRKMFPRESMRILASLIGCPFDTLWQRERRARQSRLLAVVGGAAAALAVFAGVVLNKNAQITEQNRQISEQNTQIIEQNDRISAQNEEISEKNLGLMRQASSMHVDAGYTALAGFDRKGAALEALAALESGDPQIIDARASGVLADALNLYTRLTTRTTAAAVQPVAIAQMAVNTDGTLAATIDRSAYVRLLDLTDGNILWENASFELGQTPSTYGMTMYLAEEAGRVLVTDRFAARGLSLEGGALMWSYAPAEGGSLFSALSPDGRTLAVLDGVNRRTEGTVDVVFLDTANGTEQGRVTICGNGLLFDDDLLGTPESYGAAFTADGRYLLCGIPENYPEADADGKTGQYGYYVIDAVSAETVRKYEGEKYSNPVTVFFGMDMDESSGDLFCVHFSQYAGAVSSVVCHADTGAVDTVKTDHRQAGYNGIYMPAGGDLRTGFLTSDHLAAAAFQRTLFIFDRDDGELRKGIDMNGDILDMQWYDREEEILSVLISDGTPLVYNLEHTDNNFYSRAISWSGDASGLTSGVIVAGGPALNTDKGRFITVSDMLPGTVLVASAVTDPDDIAMPSLPDGAERAGLFMSPSGKTAFLILQDADRQLHIYACAPSDLSVRAETVYDPGYSLCSLAAMDDEHVAVNGVRVGMDGSAEDFDGITAEGDNHRIRYVTLTDGRNLAYCADPYSGEPVLQCWIDGKGCGSGGSADTVKFKGYYGTAAGADGTVTCYASYEDYGPCFVSWHAGDGTVTVTQDIHPEVDMKKLAAGENGVFACADQSGKLTVYDIAAGTAADVGGPYAFSEISSMAFAAEDRYLIVLTTAERLDVYDLADGSLAWSEVLDDVLSETFSGSDRKIVCREADGGLFINVLTDARSECGYLLVLDTASWKETARIQRILSAEIPGYVVRYSGGAVHAFPYRCLGELQAMAEAAFTE